MVWLTLAHMFILVMSTLFMAKQYIDESTSRAFRVISFFAFVNVVMIHSQAVPLSVFGGLHSYLSICLFRKMTSWAVPWFFVISGYFFNRHCERLHSWSGWRRFYWNKFESLVIPYFLWTVVISLMVLPLIICVNLYAGRTVMANTPFVGNPLYVLLELFGINRENGPAMAGHLWFLRSLIIFFILGSGIYVLKRFLGRYGVAFMGLIDCMVLLLGFYGLPYCSVLFYFLIGMSINLPRLYAVVHDMFLTPMLMACCLCGSIWARITSFLCASTGVAFYFITGGFLGARLYKSFMNNTFWCYCIHVVFTSYICLGLMAIRKTSCTLGWLTSLISVICGSVLPMMLYALLRPKIPRVMRVLCGGR